MVTLSGAVLSWFPFWRVAFLGFLDRGRFCAFYMLSPVDKADGGSDTFCLIVSLRWLTLNEALVSVVGGDSSVLEQIGKLSVNGIVSLVSLLSRASLALRLSVSVLCVVTEGRYMLVCVNSLILGFDLLQISIALLRYLYGSGLCRCCLFDYPFVLVAVFCL